MSGQWRTVRFHFTPDKEAALEVRMQGTRTEISAKVQRTDRLGVHFADKSILIDMSKVLWTEVED